jgi:hypothetical protein
MSSRPSHVPSPKKSSTGRRVAAVVGVIALVAAAFAGGLLVANHSSTQRVDKAPFKDFPGLSSSTSSTSAAGSTTGSGGSGSSSSTIYQFPTTGIRFTGGEVVQKPPETPYAYVGDDGLAKTGTTAPRTLPAIISISSTSNLTDGQAIAIHVVPNKGSAIYGFEARICAPNAVMKVEYDFYPDQTGFCVLTPLSADSDAHGLVQAQPPYQVANLTFRVGVGTSDYTDVNGKHVTITCGPGHPCQLVLLLQVPYGFGFATYKLTYK